MPHTRINISFVVAQAYASSRRYLRQSFATGTFIGDYNLKAAAVVGGLGHPLFAVLHLYWFKMPWDNLILKGLAGIICLLLLTKERWPKKLKPFFPIYWHCMLIYTLPFLITLTALKNSFITTWPLWEIMMIFMLVMYIPQWLVFIFDFMVGILLAWVCYVVSTTNVYQFDIDIWLYLSTVGFAITAGSIFSYSNYNSVVKQEDLKKDLLKSLAGSIAHDLRNQLNVIQVVDEQIRDVLTASDDVHVAKEQLLDLAAHISDAVKGANTIINTTLNDLREQPIAPEQFIHVHPRQILPEILAKYSYASAADKARVSVDLSEAILQDRFILNIIPARLEVILFNVLHNALYYGVQYPNLVITIGCEVRTVNGVMYNVIYVHDTGPGVEPHKLAKLFDDFYTHGKPEGTGLGLAFCKRNMQLFGGDIICESQLGAWTKFSLLFPQVVQTQSIVAVPTSNNNSRKVTILLVDDQAVNLTMFKRKIEQALPDIFCDTAASGQEAITLLKKSAYSLVLLDIQMPQMSGIEAAQKIRKFNKHVPIIAFTALEHRAFVAQLGRGGKHDFHDYVIKSAATHVLLRTLTKWLPELDDQLTYLGAKADYIKPLVGKHILIADDSDVNRNTTRLQLEANGLQVMAVNNGKELVAEYQQSLDRSSHSTFDMIITDCNMQPHNGDKAALTIRTIEERNGVAFAERMPIIAYSGESSPERINACLRAGITDYVIKGNSAGLLLKVMANYLMQTDESSQAVSTPLNDLRVHYT